MYNSSYNNFCKNYSSNDLTVKGRFDARHSQNHTFNKLKTIPEDDVSKISKQNEIKES